MLRSTVTAKACPSRKGPPRLDEQVDKYSVPTHTLGKGAAQSYDWKRVLLLVTLEK